MCIDGIIIVIILVIVAVSTAIHESFLITIELTGKDQE